MGQRQCRTQTAGAEVCVKYLKSNGRMRIGFDRRVLTYLQDVHNNTALFYDLLIVLVSDKGFKLFFQETLEVSELYQDLCVGPSPGNSVISPHVGHQ